MTLRAALASVLAAALAGGCASKLPQTPQTFTIDAPPPSASSSGGTRFVSLRRAEVASPYGGASLVYRVGDHTIERDPYASLADPPSWLLSAAIRGYLANADFLGGVVAPAERPVDAAIEPVVTELAGDFANPAEPAAVMAIHFRVLVPDAGSAVLRPVLTKTYTRRIPISRRTADAVVSAWNQALGEIMAEFLTDLKGVLSAP